MAIRLNKRAVDNAEALIKQGRFVEDDRDSWSEHEPSADDENRFLDKHGYNEYGKWYLGVDPEKPEDTKGHYSFPFGDFKKVHRCGVLSSEVRSAQYKHSDVEKAAAHLHGMIDASREKKAA